MQTGAVVMMDALGFKGIWHDHDPSKVMSMLRRLRQIVDDDVASLERLFPDMSGSATTTFLSDTIVIGVPTNDAVRPFPVTPVTAIGHACYRASMVLNRASEMDPPLAYRGCVTFGLFDIDGPFLLGPAIDEAAEHHERAEGALVWLTPSARTVCDGDPAGDIRTVLIQRGILFPFSVPLKSDPAFEALVVSPFHQAQPPAVERAVAERILRTFDRATDERVQIKRKNTERLLARALSRLDDGAD